MRNKLKKQIRTVIKKLKTKQKKEIQIFTIKAILENNPH